MPIPRVIHQLWKDHAVPARFAALRESWARHNPGWEMRLWSDADLEALVAADYPDLLDVYRGYRWPICRADLGRYLVLERHGGVYADLDRECLRPIEPLLDGADFVIGPEPAAHWDGLVLCPSFIASIPGHAAWRAVRAAIVAARHEPDPLDTTGPFLMSRVFQDPVFAAQARILPAAWLNPVAKQDCWNGRVHDLEFREQATRDAFGLHYWHGSWHREPFDYGLCVETPVRMSRETARHAAPDGTPLVSCLMDASGDIAAARRAVDQFLRQTYLMRELIVAARDPLLIDALAPFAGAGVRALLADGADPAWRQAARVAAGPVVALWSDSDLHDPRRLEVQLNVLRRTAADACVLGRWAHWRPRERRLGVVAERRLATSLMCVAAAIDGPGDDAQAILARLTGEVRVTTFDLSRLCVRVDRGADETPLATRWEGARYDAMLEELATRLPIEDVVGAPPTPGLARGVRYIGAFRDGLGGSEAARGLAAALAAVGHPAELLDVRLQNGDFANAPTGCAPPDPDRAIEIVHLAPEWIGHAQGDGRLVLAPASPRRRRVAIWPWEIDGALPPHVAALAPLFDEIWTPSEHAARAFRAHLPTPVVVMPEAVAPSAPSLSRAELGLPAAAFVFLFSFDGLSVLARKHPDGVIEAFRRAFPRPSDEVRLVLKASNLRPEDAEVLQRLIGDRADIQLIDGYWPAPRWHALLAACDAYVSLHRAEGFGRGMAEAMFYGKPVIATGYSGNLDFMDAETAYLVPFTLTEVGQDIGPFRADMRWAQPDLDAAASLMAGVVADPAAARSVGAKAAARIKAQLSLEAVGARAAARLSALAAWIDAPAAPPSRKPGSRQAPKVLVLTPAKAAGPHLPRYVELLTALDHPADRLSVGLLESDSADADRAALAEAVRAMSGLRRIETHRHDFGFHPDSPRWRPSIQRQRRELLARSRNRLLQAALRDEDWVLWLDLDLADYPPDLLGRLLDAGEDIVVPHCIGPTGATFDLNTFRLVDGHEDPTYLVDGIYQAPRGRGRLYLDSFASETLTPVDGVGGTALLVRADLHREGLNFPTFPYRGYLETEGLAVMAKDMGRQSWGMPQLTIVHR